MRGERPREGPEPGRVPDRSRSLGVAGGAGEGPYAWANEACWLCAAGPRPAGDGGRLPPRSGPRGGPGTRRVGPLVLGRRGRCGRGRPGRRPGRRRPGDGGAHREDARRSRRAGEEGAGAPAGGERRQLDAEVAHPLRLHRGPSGRARLHGRHRRFLHRHPRPAGPGRAVQRGPPGQRPGRVPAGAARGGRLGLPGGAGGLPRGVGGGGGGPGIP